MKLPSWIKSLGLGIWTVICFIGGILFYVKAIDKPETIVNNNYDKIKNKGTDNTVDTTNNTTVANDNKKQSSKKKLRIFGKKRKK